jgi:hypothetical protein
MTHTASTTASPATGDQAAQRAALVARYPVMELIELARLVEQSQEILSRHDVNGALLSNVSDACDTMCDVHSGKAIPILVRVMESGVPSDVLEHYAQLVPPGEACGLMMVSAVGAGFLPDRDGSLVGRHVLNGRGKTALARGCFHRFGQHHVAAHTPAMTMERMSQWIGLPGVSPITFTYSSTACARYLKRDPLMVGSFFVSANLRSGLEHGAQLAQDGRISATQVLDWAMTAMQCERDVIPSSSPFIFSLSGIKQCLEIGPASPRAESQILAMCSALLADSDAVPETRAVCEQIIGICCDQRPAPVPTPAKRATAKRAP